ncbi:hypothetical protein [Actinomyces sp. oral taxon 448]|uniref:hypothetical protein n=1 Tax=Actinomyces sp. oral taxon 448 TaxID=712124 RepID=UPI00021899C9|nr:hypothetical protein [Actinomyces sp. oral taxon 448]EGQ74419.1 hypothetical protein HMPREF9062_0941 [Actinomyces sp. oral taxon 448 str. F0400]
MWTGIGCLVFGLVILVHWALAMFTDTGYGESARAMSADGGPKNNLSLIFPAVGFMCIFGSVPIVWENSDSDFVFACGVATAIAMLVLILGLIPITLPAWMYPEWHQARRARKRFSTTSRPWTERDRARRRSKHRIPGDDA